MPFHHKATSPNVHYQLHVLQRRNQVWSNLHFIRICLFNCRKGRRRPKESAVVPAHCGISQYRLPTCTILLFVHIIKSSIIFMLTKASANSRTLEADQRHASRSFPDLTARSFEADTITLKCKGDMTVSSEPDGSILRWLLRIWAVVLQPCFLLLLRLFFYAAVLKICYCCLAPCLVRHQWADFLS